MAINQAFAPKIIDSKRVSADVVVVGARCAGAATAMLLARAGYDVIVVDRAEEASDTLSTHGLARTGMVQLDRWGLLDEVVASGSPEIRDVVFHTPAGDIARPIKARSGIDYLLAPRRHVLDNILQKAAARAGAEVRYGVTVDGVRHNADGRVTGVFGRDGQPIEISARFVVGADGLKSRIGRAVGAEIVDQRPAGGGAIYTYFAGDWSAMEYFAGDQSFGGVFPTHNGEACVWVCAAADTIVAQRRASDDVNHAFDSLVISTSQELFDRTSAHPDQRRSVARSVTALPNHVRQASGDGWALVGDAGYHRDPITGHGISDAFRDAELLATSLHRALSGQLPERVALAHYAAQRDRMIGPIFDLTVRLSQLPPMAEFVELQKQLAVAIEDQAAELAARGPLQALALAA